MTKTPTAAAEPDLDAKSKALADAHESTGQTGSDGDVPIDRHPDFIQTSSGTPETSVDTGADAGAEDPLGKVLEQIDADVEAVELAKARALVAAADARERAEAEAERQKAGENLVLLNELLVIVERGNTDEKRDALFETLNKEHGMKVKNGELILQGVRVATAGPLSRTFADWCMEARRVIMATAE